MKLMSMVAAAAAILSSVPASAVTTTYSFGGGANPMAILGGTFSLDENQGKYTLSAFSATYKDLKFDLSNTGLLQEDNYLIIGGTSDGVDSVYGGRNDFLFGYFQPAKIDFASPTMANTLVATAKTSGFDEFQVTIGRTASIVIGPVGPVPEPATWAMMLLGFAMVGGAARYRRTATSAARA